MTRLPQTLTTLALASLLAACAQTPPPAAVPPAAPPAPSAAPPAPMDHSTTLAAYDWDLTAAYDARGQSQPDWRLPGRPPLRLAFRGDRLAVQNLCNVVGASVQLAGERIDVGLGLMTKRLCPEPGLMALEQRVATLLPQAQRLQLLRGPGNAAPQLVLRFADGSRWELSGAPTAATRYGSAGERVFLEVAPRTVPCNHPLMPRAQCLRVRELRYDDRGLRQGAGEWRVLQGGIEGFQHEAGLRKVVRVQRFATARPGQPTPADAPSHAYVLDMVIEAERVR
jgi:heat shock protein HslJ